MRINVNNTPEAITNEGEICPIKLVQNMIAGKWKILILWYLKEKPRRFGELEKLLASTSRGVLTQQLKQLEKDNLINRIAYNEIPPRVEYSLSEKGENFSVVLDVMRVWGEEFIKNTQEYSVDK